MTCAPELRGHEAAVVQMSWARVFLGEGAASAGETGMPGGTAGPEQRKQLWEAGQSRGPWNQCGQSVIGNLGRLQQSTGTIRLTVGTDVQNGGKSGTWQGRHDGEGG